jgi:hypothetical protein
VSFTQIGQTRTTATVILEGPFFTKDPGKTLRRNVMDMLDKLAAAMEEEVRRQVEGHAGAMPHYTGWSRDHTIGYTTSGRTGRRWTTWAAVGAVTAGMSKKDAIRTKAAAVTIEQRWHPYRSVKAGVYRSRPILTADLAKGLE